MRFKTVEQFIFAVFEKVHQRQRASLADFVFATIFARTAGIASIGRALAAHRCKVPKHAIKQFDRFLSNPKFVVADALDLWIRAVAGSTGRLLLVIDWTEFAADGHHVLMVSRVHRHGRAIPMAWKTVPSSELEGRTKAVEREVLAQVRRVVGPARRPIVLADRGFGDVAFYAWLRENAFDFVVRFRGCVHIRADGIEGRAESFVPTNGRARKCRDADLGARGNGYGTVILVKRRDMKESWCLATNLDDHHADDIVTLYGRRFTIEETFRDIKDARFGLGLSKCAISRTDRRERMLLVVSIAIYITSVVGRIALELGIERRLRANSVSAKAGRAHSTWSIGRHALHALSTREPPHYLLGLEGRIRHITTTGLRYAA